MLSEPFDNSSKAQLRLGNYVNYKSPLGEISTLKIASIERVRCSLIGVPDERFKQLVEYENLFPVDPQWIPLSPLFRE